MTHHLQVSEGEAGSILACESCDHPYLALTKAQGTLCSCRALSSLEQQFPRSLKGFVYLISMLSNVLSALRAGYDCVSEIPSVIKLKSGFRSVAGHHALWSTFEIPRPISGLTEIYQEHFQKASNLQIQFATPLPISKRIFLLPSCSICPDPHIYLYVHLYT